MGTKKADFVGGIRTAIRISTLQIYGDFLNVQAKNEKKCRVATLQPTCKLHFPRKSNIRKAFILVSRQKVKYGFVPEIVFGNIILLASAI